MKAIVLTDLNKRDTDKWGAGYYGAPRGDRKHNGIDYEVPPGCSVVAPVSGLVTKLGYPYADDLSFRYVQITTRQGDDWRVFYVTPTVEVGKRVVTDMPIGISQDLDSRYPEITPHIHLEVKRNGSFINPESV